MSDMTAFEAEHLLLGRPEGCLTCRHGVITSCKGDRDRKGGESKDRLLCLCDLMKDGEGRHQEPYQPVFNDDLNALPQGPIVAELPYGSFRELTLAQLMHIAVAWPPCERYEIAQPRHVVELLDGESGEPKLRIVDEVVKE